MAAGVRGIPGRPWLCKKCRVFSVAAKTACFSACPPWPWAADLAAQRCQVLTLIMMDNLIVENMHVRNHLSFLYAALRHSTLRQHLQPSKANPARTDQRGAQRARSDASCELARHARAARATRGSAYSALLRLASHTAHMRLGESRSAVCSAGWPSQTDCPPVVLAGMIVQTIVFSRRNPISVILGRGGRARARRSEDQTLPTPFCTARAAPEYPVIPGSDYISVLCSL